MPYHSVFLNKRPPFFDKPVQNLNSPCVANLLTEKKSLILCVSPQFKRIALIGHAE